ncbi:MAG: hypothetical protein ABIB46_00475 [bacterium]
MLVIDDPQTQALIEKMKQDENFKDTGLQDFPKTSNDLFGATKKSPNSIVLSSIAVRTYAQMAQENPLQISDFQNWIEKVLLPKLNNADNYLSKIETYPNFVYIIDLKKMDKSIPEDQRYKELDLGEVYAAHAILGIMKGILNIGVSFDFDFDRAKMEKMINSTKNNETAANIIDYYNPFVDPNYNFMGLRLNGKINMLNAKQSFISSTQKIEAGLDFILAEKDDQKDDILKKEEIDLNDANLTKKVCKDIRDCFNGITFTVREGYPEKQNGKTCTWDEKGKYPIQINLGNYFDNAPSLKAFIPIYDQEGWPCLYDKSGNAIKYYEVKYCDGKKCIQFIDTNVDWATIKFNDPSFCGLFPNMTNNIIAELINANNSSYAIKKVPGIL